MSTLLYLPGSGASFRCEGCGANVFTRQPTISSRYVYRCNGCGDLYEGEIYSTKPKCPDDGACHHDCGLEDGGDCFRVQTCGPLSGVFPGDYWPLHLLKMHGAREDIIHQAEILEQEGLVGDFARWYYGDDGDDDAEVLVNKVLELLKEQPEGLRAHHAGFMATDRVICTYHGWLCHNPLDCDLVTLYRRKPGTPGLDKPVSKRHT